MQAKQGKYWPIIILGVLGIFFIWVYSYLAIGAPVDYNAQVKPIFNSPDETANYYFADLFYKTGDLQFTEPANYIAQGLVSPRSAKYVNGQTVPAGFIGLPLIYGFLNRFFVSSSINFFTPFLAVIAIMFFYFLLKEIFNKEIALISSVFAFIVPAWWYYSSKGLMPNAPFASFFIIALYYLISSIKYKKIISYLLFGFFSALALMVRPSEADWILPLFMALVLLNFKKIKWLRLVYALIAGLIVFLPVLLFNAKLYGQPLAFGYPLNVQAGSGDFLTNIFSVFKAVFLPFGFYPKNSLINFYHYTFLLFPLWSWLILISGLGFFGYSIYLLAKKRQGDYLLYFLLLSFISLYLVIYYGSWTFHDNPDPNAVTIGTSYLRYWVLIYLFSLPFVAWLIVKICHRQKMLKIVFTVFLFTALGIVSASQVMVNGDESLSAVKDNIGLYQTIAQTVAKNTPDNSIIIADTLDKALFPYRKVIFRLNIPADYDKIRELLIAGYPVYDLHFTRTEDDLAYYNKQVLKPYGFYLEKSVLDFPSQSLYQAKLIDK